ncbi:MAG: bifunctional diaminohydroxyphosphoribosylaminopyrimidine deaminase/5-amino-6-(5-phosphoribosylamino)uracil reductase RibD [Clostridium sp.]|nr:bifunctional diaminohydroxyphosphoribosylaminopyrimidine deaminase/5-amino-6-(5-phosphoribosylamino)uracil reductase RibD [Prevotella sp.]MCM1429549.1 bifunctional diaminohydroxyphosphoribosylaminopyrimidine deaminase/5-amino-6-(5-phosphoribosylamino)uracil reductase RibD [Clostridium sp.]MCM1476043.1 bifunctional diaminohydroxyphosphoribosylaminopyrimidine deaminase/5-amino-6-(5-phosphoribosylamino)uracil reductase RibD [Muribaculaceae bacterium]
MKTDKTDTLYMRRALQLAALGQGAVSPNPMVGAVIVARGRIIGEGWHRQWGGPHAEVNAIASVAPADSRLLSEATIYVTLEPCSHWGKTPPCAAMLVDKGIGRVVIGAPDPNPLVSGRGTAMLRQAGIPVTDGVLLEECIEINRRFMTAQTFRRPWIQLKFAQSADGVIGFNDKGNRLKISTPLSSVWMHRERSMADAIMAGSTTVELENPRLDCRLWPGRTPLFVGFDSQRLPADRYVLQRPHILKSHNESLEELISRLFKDEGISSLMVEGGRFTLQKFIDANLYDEIRVETSPIPALSLEEDARYMHAVMSPMLPKDIVLHKFFESEGNLIRVFRRKEAMSR